MTWLLKAAGWEVPVGEVSTVDVLPVVQNGVAWLPLHLADVSFGQTAHLLLLQGLSPARLFLGLHLCGDDVSLLAPFELLGFQPSDPWKVPYVFYDVRLGRVLEGDRVKALPQLVEQSFVVFGQATSHGTQIGGQVESTLCCPWSRSTSSRLRQGHCCS